MAGGPDWFFAGREASVYAYTTGTEAEGNLRHFRRKEVAYTIRREEPAATVEIGDGDLLQTSGVLVFMAGPTRQCSIQVASGKLVCEADGSIELERPTGFFQRTQVWRRIYHDEEYNRETGEVIE